ncbi:hypothetical protein GCM10027431_11110 [Lysobacter rhizosphaerae]
MPRFYCDNDFPRFSYDQATQKFMKLPGLELPASTLGELLVGLEAVSGIRVVPHDPPKYFRYYPAGSAEFHLVDVHIDRDGLVICPKQDLAFLLESGDTVEAGSLEC